MKIKVNLLLLIIITLNSAYSYENNILSWPEKLLDFNVDNKWEVIYLSNNSDYKLNINLKILSIKNNQAIDLKKEIIVHPNNFVLKANSKKLIRVFRRYNNNIDKLYYIYPEAFSKDGIIENDFAINHKLLVIFRPTIIKREIKAFRRLSYLRIANKGNTTGTIENITHCDKECIQYSNKIIFPGDEYIIELRLDGGEIDLSKKVHDKVYQLIV